MQPSPEEEFFYLIQAIILTAVIIFLSWYQYRRAGHAIADKELRKKTGIRLLVFRFLAGFIMGFETVF